ncbi:MAG TPA: hypothetical protein VNZ45_03170, partial [Bacteroidia bacterium]|nr:hypothetical protein [Bacteroidia bacterium]
MKFSLNLPFTIYHLPLVLCFSLLVFNSSITYSQCITIHGKVKVSSIEKRKQLWDASILIMKDTAVIASAEVDDNSNFSVKINKPDPTGSTMRADLYFVSLGKIVYIKPVALIPNSTVYCDIELPNQYNKNV